jgi:predicted ArsR family transcriptional regulator
MKPIKAITLEELLQAQDDALISGTDVPGLSTTELSCSLGWTLAKVRRHLRVLHQEGRLTCRMRLVKNIAGRMSKVPVFSMTPKVQDK